MRRVHSGEERNDREKKNDIKKMRVSRDRG